CDEGYTGFRCDQSKSNNIWDIIQVTISLATLFFIFGIFCYMCRRKK
ncbi:hypothetical protein NPIL_614271, partial [Nephila pilipes]